MINIKENVLAYIQDYAHNPLNIIDLISVLFLAYVILKFVKDSRAWQLVKGIALLVVATWLSRLAKA